MSTSAYPIQICSESIYRNDELGKDRTCNMAGIHLMNDVTQAMFISDYVESRNKGISGCKKSFVAKKISRKSRHCNSVKYHITFNKTNTYQTTQSNSSKRKYSILRMLKSSQRISKAEYIEVTPHDILCRTKGDVTKITNTSTSVGNNRINVLINMQVQKYCGADGNGRLAIACEIKNMSKKWGRFIRKEDNSNVWIELTCKTAIAAIVRKMNKCVKLVSSQS